MTEAEFWLSTPRRIMLRLMYKGIESGALKTKEQVNKEQRKNVDELIGLFGVRNKKDKE